MNPPSPRASSLASLLLLGLLPSGCGGDAAPRDAGSEASADGGARSCVGALSWRWIPASSETAPGPDGIGGERDLEVQNGTLRAVFSDLERTSGIAASGGTLIDLHPIGRSDHLNELSQLGGPSQGLQVMVDALAIVEEASDHLVVEARGHLRPQPVEPLDEPAVVPDPGTDLEVITRYTFYCDEPSVHLRSSLENVGTRTYETGTGAFGLLDVMLWGTRSLEPFCPVPGAGDRCPSFDISNPTAGLVDALYVGSTGSLLADPGSFAFYSEDPFVPTLLGVHDDQVSAFGSFVFGDDVLAPGDIRTSARAIVVGERADASSATDLALEALEALDQVQLGTVRGTVLSAPSSPRAAERGLLVLAIPLDRDPLNPDRWTPITTVRLDEAGAFEARVPAGAIAWELRLPGRLPVRGVGGDVLAGATLELGDLPLDPPAELRVQVREITSGVATPLPARLIVRGVGATPDPILGREAGASPAANIALTDGDGDVTLLLEPGEYEVFATHGPYFTIARQQLVLDAAGADLSFELTALDVLPPGFITADFHVHSAASFDSSLPIEDRLMAYLAEGVEAIVSTEHDVIFDYGPTLSSLEATLPPTWRGRLRTFVGLESTAAVPQAGFVHTTGHHNAFPLLPQPGAHKNGAPIDEGLDLGILYERLRGLPSPLRALVQMNHARSSRRGSIWLGYFDSCGYDPSLPLDPASPCFSAMGPMGTRPWDFDAMEVINGNSALGFVHMNRDWLGLLRFAPGGRLPVATANSDSHELVHERAGYPLTLLRVPGPLSSLDDAALVAALEGGSVGGSLGAFVWIGARQAGSSDAFMPPSRIPLAATSLEVEIRLAAAPWVPIDELRLRLGGEVVARLSVSSGDLSAPADPYGVAGIVRYAGVVDLSGIALSADTFLTAEAGFALPRVGDLDGDGLVDATDNDGDDDVDADDLVDGIVLPAPTSPMDVIAPGALPMAFTNPIFIDVDGSAIYEPPMTPLLD